MLSLGRKRSTRAFCCERAPCCAARGRLLAYKKSAPARGLSPSALVRRSQRASCGLQRQASARCRRRAGGRCQWREGVALKPSVRARSAALVVVSVCSMKEHCTAERPLSVGARPWCQWRPQCQASAACPALARSLSLGRRRSTQTCCAHVPCRAGRGRLMPHRRARLRREASFFRRASVVRRASGGLQCQAGAACRRRRTSGRCRWGGDAALKLSLCTCRAALVVVGLYLIGERRNSEKPLSFGAHPWCVVPAAANAKPKPSPSQRRVVSCGAGAPSVAVAREEAQHLSLLCTRVVLR